MPDSRPAPPSTPAVGLSSSPASEHDAPVTGDKPLVFCGNDGQLYLLEPGADEARRLSWRADDFALMPGMPAMPGAAGALEEGLVFLHPAPSPDGRWVAAFGVDPADEIGEFDEDDEEWETVLDLPEDQDDTAGPGLLPVSLPEGKIVAVPVGMPDDEEEEDGPVFWPGARLFVMNADGVRVQDAWGFDDGGPIHLEWAPDGRRFLALRQQEAILELHLVDPDKPEATLQLGEGAPMFWAWQPGGDRIVLRCVDPDGGAELQIAAPDSDQPTRLLGPSGSFYAPAWRPDGSLFALGTPGAREDRLALADPDGKIIKELLDYPGRAAFRWNAAGSRLAVAIAPEGTGSFDTLLDLDIESGEQVTRYQGTFVAFEWLPGGGGWLICTSDEEAGHLHWAVLDPDGGCRAIGGAFSPSRETMIALHFFDQVAGSRSFLSDDGRTVAWAGHPADLPAWIGRNDMPGAASGGGTQPVPRILLTALDGGPSHIVGVGPYACFPPSR